MYGIYWVSYSYHILKEILNFRREASGDCWTGEYYLLTCSTSGKLQCRSVDTILLSYINKMRDSLDLPLKQPALCVFDVFAAHQTNSFFKN